MRLPLSKSEIERLGGRLVAAPEPSSDDLDALHRLLGAYAEVLAGAVGVVRRELGVAPTARVKNTGTILEKLGRYGGSWLKSIQDLAGMRIVVDFDRREQDELVARIVELFADASRPPKVVDRRAEPVQGYRAVHVVAFPERVPVEIQVRTRAQHEWAELFEKLADVVGRGIRYGEPPDHWLPERDRRALSTRLREIYDRGYDIRRTGVTVAISTADFINTLEAGEQVLDDARELDELRRERDEALAQLRGVLEAMSDLDRRAARATSPDHA